MFLSEKEEAIIDNIIRNIERECDANIDGFTRKIIIAQIESLLSYSV